MAECLISKCKTMTFNHNGETLTGVIVGYEWDEVEYCALVYVASTNSVYRI